MRLLDFIVNFVIFKIFVNIVSLNFFMEIPLKDLLPDAIKRARIGRQVQAHTLLQRADEALYRLLPSSTSKQARALSYHYHVLVIGCLSSATGYFLKQQEEDLLHILNREQKGEHVRCIRIKILHHLEAEG
ncbi:hypothetical protein A2239_03670 [Candidatus Uhrbacteria bacterium RIFOXYA2_FULL_40_9]|nr:MAG: hypothetical protein A2239_03670 [Candidatus Uhrbacteria bacterium RIFOXYA2_FULL_40_9]HBK35115.1 hypothetical protein [Candidatus Uhrbacteria bacterium]HCB56244.1 hypothetical protein [Candidatus Uhrbacteria bacterium]